MAFLDQLYLLNPWKLNPFHSIIIIGGLAYVPHFVKELAVTKKFEASGQKLTLTRQIAESRADTKLAADNTPEGRRIALYMGCHANGLEALTYYSAAILSAVIMNVPEDIVTGAASAFVIVRLVYIAVYLSPWNGPLRSVVFTAGAWISIDLLLRAANNFKRN